MKAVSLFSGVGGFDYALKTKGINIVWSNDFDQKASETFRKNFTHDHFVGDIKTVSEKDIPDHDILCAGFPCQSFSLAGNKKGFLDPRGNLFFDVVRILKEKQPRYFILENVKHIMTVENGKVFTIIKETLTSLDYYLYPVVLSTYEHGGIPQIRERVFFIGSKEPVNFHFEKVEPLEKRRFVDLDNLKNDKYYYKKVDRKIEVALNEFKDDAEGSFYQWRRTYVRKNKKDLCPTLTANMGTGGHNVPIIKTNFGFRKLTPRECFNLQGFPKDYVLPNIADSHLYKQAGNSVSPVLVKKILDKIF